MLDQPADPAAGADWLQFLFIGVFSLMILASLIGWGLGFKRLASQRPLLAFAGRELPLGFIHLVSVFALWLLSQVLVGAILLPMYPRPREDAPPEELAEFFVRLMGVSSVAQLIITVLAAGFLIVRYRSFQAAAIRFDRWLRDIKTGVIAFLMIVPAILVVQWLLTFLVPYEHSTLEALAANPTTVTVLVSWLAAVIIAPIAEEFFFRGVLQGWLQRLGSAEPEQVLFGGWSKPGSYEGLSDFDLSDRSSSPDSGRPEIGNPYRPPSASALATEKPVDSAQPPYWPIFVSAALFAMVHLGQGPAPIPLFLLGLGLGYVFRQTGSLLPCIVLHFLLNGYRMLWFTLNVFFGEGIPQ